jgi:hypothetical protein
MKERGFYRVDSGKVYEYVLYAETGEVAAFGPIDKFGGGEKPAFGPVAASSPDEAQRVIREKLGEGTFEDDWV